MNWQFQVTNQEDSPEAKELHNALRLEIESEVGLAERKPLFIAAHQSEAPQTTPIAGLRGYSHWSWFYISHLWVNSDQRSSGLGAELLKRVEHEAANRGCIGVYVDTFNERAKKFYERNGYGLVGKIEDFPPGHHRYFFAKRITASSTVK
jgi:ribosomal protein S18 acetylase RimI-like enzyme